MKLKNVIEKKQQSEIKASVVKEASDEAFTLRDKPQDEGLDLQEVNSLQKVSPFYGEKIIPESRRDMRALAFHFVYAVDRFNYTVPLEEIIQNFKDGFNLDIADDSLAVKMAKGTISMQEETDNLIKPLLRNWKLERLGCCTRLILRLALWEFHQEEAVPSIIINEAIELAKCFAEKDAYKFINGILDEASKKLTTEETESPCDKVYEKKTSPDKKGDNDESETKPPETNQDE